ncbi:MAG: PQQ-binding-like beta-propeller repeat protein [Verrucomicrobiales bacterium]|nr:PQQ-binding-like beta-propeller repeat protein [Verrucomicrobiales bacterium]
MKYFILLLCWFQLAHAEWPGFRGDGSSTISLPELPLEWSDQKNVQWRAKLKGGGQSSPVGVTGRVYVSSVGGDKKENLYLECFDIARGKSLWEKTFQATQTVEEVTDMISRGAPTPVCDENGVYAFYETGDLFGLDHSGNVMWERRIVTEFGEFVGGHGVGSSLVNTPEALILLIDHDGPSYLIGIDKKTGKTRWKTERSSRVSWTTPLYITHNGVEQLIVSSNGSVDSYQLSDGKQIWTVTGVSNNTVASPSLDGDQIIIGSSNPGDCMAIQLGGSGDVTDTHLRWRAASVTSSFGSPLVYQKMVFFVNRAGVIQAVDSETGSLLWQHRLPASTWASPLSAGERVYCFCKDGRTAVLKPDRSGPGELVINALAVEETDRIYGYAVYPGRFVIRLERELICIGFTAPTPETKEP